MCSTTSDTSSGPPLIISSLPDNLPFSLSVSVSVSLLLRYFLLAHLSLHPTPQSLLPRPPGGTCCSSSSNSRVVLHCKERKLRASDLPPPPSFATGTMEARLAFLLCYLAASAVGIASATTFALYNKCPHTVWPGIQPSAGKPVLARGGFRLLPNQAYSLKVPEGWSGRIWGRQDCVFDASGKGHCATGDCGGALYCNGMGGVPPATLAEITLGEQDFYDVSLVDGYNLAVSVTPFRGSGKCSYAGCVSDLNRMCPVGLQVRDRENRVVACKSACFAFNSPRYCCTGSFGNPQTCRPTAYSRIFKSACPKAYSYAYDDPTSIVTCSGGSYLITYCPHH